MLIVLSQANALDFTAAPHSVAMTSPQMTDQVAELAKVTRNLRVADLKRMMSLSDSLAKLNRERFQAFDAGSDEGVQAAFDKLKSRRVKGKLVVNVVATE
jgi:cytoplasmic iron level regulating protein YaaA (DUF328/UPF0246 family)